MRSQEKCGPRVLVLLATSSGAKWLPQQIASIKAQIGVRLDIVASDDRSKDCTRSLLQKLAPSGQLRILPDWPGTGSSAGNFFRLIRECDLSDYDYVALADQDDVWYPDKLHRGCEALRLGGAAGYSAAVRAFWPDGRSQVVRQAGRVTEDDFLFEGAGQGCTFVVTRHAFEFVQSFVRRVTKELESLAFHDWLIYALVRSIGGAWIFDPLPSMDYRQHAANVMGARGGWTAVRRRLALLRSGWYKAQVEAIVVATSMACPDTAPITRYRRLRPLHRRKLPSIRWLAFIATSSRRRFAERLVLLAAACLGWL